LQAGQPSSDVLLYFPMEDLWQTPDGLLIPLTVPGKAIVPLPFYATATTLWQRGYAFDAVSDRLLAHAATEGSNVRLGGNTYRAIVLPRVRVMAPETRKNLRDLVDAGATLIVEGSGPEDVPGFAHVEERRQAARSLSRREQGPNGKALQGDDVDALLQAAGVVREPMVDAGLKFIRRTHPRGAHYFVANTGERPLDGWVTLATPATSAVILDPRSDASGGIAALRHTSEGRAQVYLQMAPGESRIVRTFRNGLVSGRPAEYAERRGASREISGTWKVQFLEGGPALPAGFETRELASWTVLGDPEAARFAGTARYAIDVERPEDTGADDWLLDLGRVAESARVRLNGREVATLWSRPFEVRIGRALRPGRNLLEVDVTNLAANRIADLDRRGVKWKSFHEINFVNIDYKPFDASSWPVRDSGLIGPVRLVGLKAPAIDAKTGAAGD
jgi:hypothetical protein